MSTSAPDPKAEPLLDPSTEYSSQPEKMDAADVKIDAPIDETEAGEGGEKKAEEAAAESGVLSPKTLLTALPVLGLGVGAIFCLVTLIPGLPLALPAAIVGAAGSVFACGCITRYGGMRHQLNRFKKQNTRLKRTSTKLERDVSDLEEVNGQLAVQVDKLEGTVDELQTVSDSLQSDLDKFADIRQNLEQFAKETGADIKSVVGDVNGIYDKIYGLTLKNERTLLQRIAQDLEFLDRDEGLSEQEFMRFLQRIPQHLQERFKKMNKSFKDIAGEDNIIDHTEMKELIDTLMEENAAKTPKAGAANTVF